MRFKGFKSYFATQYYIFYLATNLRMDQFSKCSVLRAAHGQSGPGEWGRLTKWQPDVRSGGGGGGARIFYICIALGV